MNSDKKLVKLISKAYKILKDGSTFSKCDQWLKYEKRNIRLLKKYLKINKRTLAVSLKCRITSSKAVWIALNKKINNSQKKGQDVLAANRQRDRIRWEEMEITVRDRIRTGSVVRLKHKDKRYFFDDAKSMVVLR